MDMAEAAKTASTALAGLASAVGTAVGVKTLWEKRKAAQKAFRDSLATKEQIERHRIANEEHVKALREELTRRLDSQDRDIRDLREDVQQMPLRIVEALKQ